MPGFDDDDLRWLLALLEQENLAEIEVHQGENEVLVRKAVPQLAPAPGEVSASSPEGSLPEHNIPVLSPMAGVFYASASPEVPPFVEVGDRVEHGDTVGLIEAMKLFNEVSAPASGLVVKLLVEPEQQVEADQPLMIIERQAPH